MATGVVRNLVANDNQIASALGNDNYWSNFPLREEYMSQTGTAGSDITMLHLKKYAINIDSDTAVNMKKAPEYPVMRLLDGESGPQSTKDLWLTWRYKFEGSSMSEYINNNVLRTRDYLGNVSDSAWGVASGSFPNASTTGTPSKVGDIFDIGGKLMFQKAWHSVDGIAGLDKVHTDAGAHTINISSADLNTPNATTPAGLKGEVKETSIVTVDGKRSLVLAFARSDADTQGQVADYIKTVKSILETRNYNMVDKTNITWAYTQRGGGSYSAVSPHTWSYKYVENSSSLCHLWFNTLSCKIDNASHILYQKVFPISQFVFDLYQDKFFIVLDIDGSNIDFIRYSDVVSTTGTGVAELTSGNFYIVQKGGVSGGGASYSPGDVFRMKATLTTTVSGSEFYPVRTCFLMEEVNTSRSTDLDRVMAPAQGFNSKGHTRMADRIATNIYYDYQDAAAESQNFDITQLEGGLSESGERYTNNMQLFISKCWGYTSLRENLTPDLAKYIVRQREDNINKFRRRIENAMIFGTGDNSQQLTGNMTSNLGYSGSTGLAGDFKGKMDGLLSYKAFPLTYMRMPFYQAMSGYNVQGITDGGAAFAKWIKEVCRALSFNNIERVEKSYSVPCSMEMIDLLTMMNAFIQSKEGGNVYGADARVVYSPGVADPGSAGYNMGIPNWKYRDPVANITLSFFYDKSLDLAQKIKIPRHLFGKEYLNPRYTLILIDRSKIKTFAHQSRPDRLYSGLQPNHVINMHIEGIQGSRSLMVEEPDTHMILDFYPEEV